MYRIRQRFDDTKVENIEETVKAELGKLSLAECYLLSLPYLSWKMVLIGDPLYRPFAAFGQSD